MSNAKIRLVGEGPKNKMTTPMTPARIRKKTLPSGERITLPAAINIPLSTSSAVDEDRFIFIVSTYPRFYLRRVRSIRFE
jgi:hypothetical protein